MSKVKVLFLAANSSDFIGLGLGNEFRAIKEKIRAADYRDSLELISELAVRPEDLLHALNQYRPHVVHFSGHGSSAGEIILEDSEGKSQPVRPEAIKEVFKNLKDNIRIVFLNACFSKAQAEAITEIIDCAIGMNTAVPDKTAIIFATAFYGAIGFGRSVQNAFNQGKDRLRLEGILGENIPELLVRRGVDSSQIILVGSADAEVVPETSQQYKEHGDANQADNRRHGRVPHLGTGTGSEALEKEVFSWVTNPTGRSFLAYSRLRMHEAELLIAAQHDRGIPTWHDLKQLDEEQTERAVSRMLADSANAILWLTPEMKSDPTRLMEVTSILRRATQQSEDGFFVLLVPAGGLDYKQAEDVFDGQLSLDKLQVGKLPKVNDDPIGSSKAAEIARRVLKQRMAEIDYALPEGEPVRLELFTRPSAAFKPGTALSLDWIERFDGRLAKPDAWEQFLLPALKDVADAVQSSAFARAVEVSGLAAIPAATALGCVFLAPRGVKIGWHQPTPGRDDQVWSINVAREASGFQAETIDDQIDARDLAVLVSVAANVEAAFEASKDLPQFRGIIRVTKAGGDKHDLSNAGQALDVAQLVVEEIRRARNEYQQVGCVHLFMAVPVGLAMMIGQLLNTLGSVQTYEHIPDDGVGKYRPAVLLYPSG